MSLSSPRSLSRDGESIARRGGRKSLPLFLSPFSFFSFFQKIFLSLSPLEMNGKLEGMKRRNGEGGMERTENVTRKSEKEYREERELVKEGDGG